MSMGNSGCYSDFNSGGGYSDDSLRGTLLEGEEVLWSGRPAAGKLFHSRDLFLVPFSLLWTAFAVKWELDVMRMGEPFFMLWGLPFIAMGLYLIAGRFLLLYVWKKQTVYAVTTKRVLRIRGKHTDFLTYARIPSVTKSVGRSGFGSIFFGNAPVRSTAADADSPLRTRGYRGSRVQSFYMEDVPDAERVYQIIAERITESS